MTRRHIAGAAFLMIALLPGCGIFGNGPGLCNRCNNNNGMVNASPVSYPGVDPGCGATVIPSGAPIYGAPIYGAPGGGVPMESLPPPIQNIPKARIEEGKGKPYDPDSVSRNGPVLTVPVNGTK